MFYSQLNQKLDQLMECNERNWELLNTQNEKILARIEDLSREIKELYDKYDCYTMKEMDHLEKIDECKKEVIDIREKLYRLDWEPNQNLKQRLQSIAGMESAEFIIKNMNSVPALNVTLNILDLAYSKCTIEGMILEFGVFSGRTINHIAELTDQVVYGFDSFEGLPEDWRSGFEKGTFKTNSLPNLKDNVQLVKGWFNETLPSFLEKHNEVCSLIHVDCDLYSSAKCIFDNLKDRIVSGTVIVFDEYFNYPGWQEGEYKAFCEFISETKLEFEYIGYVEISEQVAVRIL